MTAADDPRALSYSQIEDWTKCEAAAYAHRIAKTWTPRPRPWGIEGRYLEALLIPAEKDQDKRELAHDPTHTLTTKSGAASAARKRATAAANRVRKTQPALMAYLTTGNHQVWLEGELFGAVLRASLDTLSTDYRRFVDCKYLADLGETWEYCPERRKRVPRPWFTAHGYHRQAALYRELCRQNYEGDFTGYLAAVTKEDPCDSDLVEFSSFQLDEELKTWGPRIERILQVKRGEVEPARCERTAGKDHCEYCRLTKFITGPLEVEL